MSHVTNMFFAHPVFAGETENTVFGILSLRSSSPQYYYYKAHPLTQACQTVCVQAAISYLISNWHEKFVCVCVCIYIYIYIYILKKE